ncbi:MAG TPA: hypothetical protein VFZ48_02130 [Candidatus Saccharimonadales bacterium]
MDKKSHIYIAFLFFNAILAGVALGAVVGGIVLGDIGLGIGIGIMLGAIIGVMATYSLKQEKKFWRNKK